MVTNSSYVAGWLFTAVALLDSYLQQSLGWIVIYSSYVAGWFYSSYVAGWLCSSYVAG